LETPASSRPGAIPRRILAIPEPLGLWWCTRKFELPLHKTEVNSFPHRPPFRVKKINYYASNTGSDNSRCGMNYSCHDYNWLVKEMNS
jgi:hypothetical protein